MAALPVEILFGIYLGILTGIIPGLVAWALGFTFKYFTGVTIPGFGVVVLSVALAGVNGGLMALADPTITQSANAVTVTTAILVVLMISLYAHSRGDAMGAEFPRRLSFRQLRERTLSADVMGSLAGRDQVRIRVVGEVADMEGYPPLSDELRAAIRDTEWTFPADLRVSELEARLAERLQTEYDLGDVSVTVGEGGRAAVVAAPPFSGLSKRVPENERAVSVEALVPTGLARNDEVMLITADAQVRGTVLSARSRRPAGEGGPGPDGTRGDAGGEQDGSGDEADDSGDGAAVPQPVRAPTTTGGEGRITVAVTRTDAGPLVRADRARVVVESRGVRREYELVSLLRRAGRRFRRVTVRAGGPLDGVSVGAATVRDRYGVAVMAVQSASGWELAPRGGTELSAGDELFAVGTRERLDAFAEAVA
ncbi:MAG: potassium channel family protein [Haloarculaceae archaeon]